MARDDFFIIAYRILAYLYACMKSGEKPDMSVVSYEKLGICECYWNDIIISLIENDYIKGISIIKMCGQTGIKSTDPKITMQGIEFLQENSAMKKAYEFLKDLKELIPGI